MTEPKTLGEWATYLWEVYCGGYSAANRQALIDFAKAVARGEVEGLELEPYWVNRHLYDPRRELFLGSVSPINATHWLCSYGLSTWGIEGTEAEARDAVEKAVKS